MHVLKIVRHGVNVFCIILNQTPNIRNVKSKQQCSIPPFSKNWKKIHPLDMPYNQSRFISIKKTAIDYSTKFSNLRLRISHIEKSIIILRLNIPAKIMHFFPPSICRKNHIFIHLSKRDFKIRVGV
ncbi:protein of unknown function (plasmid) [Azospirillum lipoferum 4B]|uniref:Uncharacterized protein n=1 Tax=Azospirillum lipoferum (strain 4B) TaxID=862719 RepID=G7ZAE2_AZOL4|nr:protein of unknown function [Azospirillum lipoferum 4B]